MKLIIDIDERDYKYIQNHLDTYYTKEELFYVFKKVANGIPLEDIRTDVHRHKMDFYPSNYTLINTLIDKWINKGVDV